MIKLVVSDLDGTLLNSKTQVSKGNRSAIAAFQNKGGIFSISTGRFLQSGELVARQLQLSAPCVYADGSVIKRTLDPEPLFASKLDSVDFVPLVNACQRIKLDIEIYDLKTFYVESLTPLIKHHGQILGVPPMKQAFEPIVAKFSQLLSKPHHWLKAVIIADSEAKVTQVKKLKKEFSGKLRFSSAKGPAFKQSAITYFNVTHPKVSKGAALKKLMKILKIPKSAIMAIGDAPNDESLFDIANLKIAVSNASPQLAEKADYLVADAEKDGVAEAIEKYAL